MTDEQRMLAEMADDLFSRLGSNADIETDWSAIEDVALTGLLLGEDQGGFGGSWEDATIVFRLAGYHAVALPIVEAAIAAAIIGKSEGRATLASRAKGELSGDRFTGEVSGICYGTGACSIVAPLPGGGSFIFDAKSALLKEGESLAGERRDATRLEDCPVIVSDTDVFALGALARVSQIAGALDAALEKSVAYVNERQQFGRPLAKFQAVQQNLATFACEAAAANCAAMGAAQAMSSKGEALYEIAAAKLRANRAIEKGTAVAHQSHGAIGFTREYSLHPLTRRLWSWRSEFGTDAYWSAQLGERIVSRGADQFWPDLTALTG